MQITTDTRHININELNDFIHNHPRANFFQSVKAYNFFNKIDCFEPVLFVATESRAIIGTLLAVFMREGQGIKGFFSRRCIVWGGPLVDGNSHGVYSALLDALNRLAKRKAIYTEFRNFHDASNFKGLHAAAGYRFYEHLNMIVFVPSFEKARANLSKSKKRQINKSIKNGTEIIEPNSLDQVSVFYKILDNMYREKVKKPLPPFDLFEQFFIDKKLGKYFFVSYEGRIIGGIMCPVYRGVIYEWYVCGLDDAFHHVYPSVLATWAPIEFAARTGLKQFDFMGAGKPDQDYGVREFKSKFGGEVVNYGRFVRINNKALYKVGKAGLTILARIS